MTPHEIPSSHIKEGKTDHLDYTLEITCPVCNHRLVFVAFPSHNFEFENEEPIETIEACPHTIYLFDNMPWSWIKFAPERKRDLIDELISLKPELKDELQKKYEFPLDYSKVDIDTFIQYRPRSARMLAKSLSQKDTEKRVWFADIHRPAGSVGCCSVDMHYSIVIEE